MNKKIWIFFSLILVVIVIGAGAGITKAYFSDTETSSQNSIAAGTWTNWYDIHWTYRTPISITNSGAVLADYQIQLTISAANSYPVGNMKADFGDIRFTDDSGTTLIPYWIESITASPQSAVVWVKVPVISASPATTNIYLYYGYSSAASTSNPYQTFVLFEDFETGSLNTNAGRPLGPGQGVWTVTASGTGSPAASATLVQSGSESPSFTAPHGSYVLKLNDTNNARNITAYCDFSPTQTLFVVDYYARPRQTGATFEMRVNNGATNGPYMRFNTTNIQTNYNGTWTSRQTFAANSTYTFNLNNIKTAGAAALDTYDLTITGPTSSSNSGLRFGTTGDYTGLNRVYLTGSTTTTGILYIDIIKVRAYAPSIPSATPGTQQSQLSEVTVNWLEFNWYFRKPITITNPNAYALTDYRLNISVPLITGKMQADFSDLRFTADDGLTPLKYYIQSSSSPANIWVKVPSIAASGTTTIIYMYYGYYYGSSSPATPPLDLNNSLAGTYSFYDEMDDSALSQWTASSGSITKTRVTSPVQNGTYSMQISNTATNTYVTSTSFTAGNNCVIEFGIRALQTNRIWEVRLLGDPSGTTLGPHFRLNTGGTPPVQYSNNGTWTAFSPAITWTSGIFYPVQINPAFVDSNIYQFNFNGNQRSAIPFGATTTTSLKQIVFYGTGSPGTIYVDSVKVYGYAASAPTYVFGGEQ